MANLTKDIRFHKVGESDIGNYPNDDLAELDHLTMEEGRNQQG